MCHNHRDKTTRITAWNNPSGGRIMVIYRLDIFICKPTPTVDTSCAYSHLWTNGHVVQEELFFLTMMVRILTTQRSARDLRSTLSLAPLRFCAGITCCVWGGKSVASPQSDIRTYLVTFRNNLIHYNWVLTSSAQQQRERFYKTHLGRGPDLARQTQLQTNKH